MSQIIDFIIMVITLVVMTRLILGLFLPKIAKNNVLFYEKLVEKINHKKLSKKDASN